jgi:hypothetical protein
MILTFFTSKHLWSTKYTPNMYLDTDDAAVSKIKPLWSQNFILFWNKTDHGQINP